jgi:hypothetical protein
MFFSIGVCSSVLYRSAVITIPDGKEITLTPEMINIERKTFKQSGKFKLRQYPGVSIDSFLKFESLLQTSSSHLSVLAAYCTVC